MQHNLLSRTEAAAYLGVKPQTLAVWFSTKRYPLPLVKVGRYVKYRLSDLDAFINANTHGSLHGDIQGAAHAK